METNHGQGTVRKVFHNKTKEGDEYVGVLIDDARYSAFAQEVIAQLVEGQQVEFDWQQRGKYKTITRAMRVETVGAAAPAASAWLDRDERIGRQVALKAAAVLVAARGLESEAAAAETIRLAEKLAAWVLRAA